MVLPPVAEWSGDGPGVGGSGSFDSTDDTCRAARSSSTSPMVRSRPIGSGSGTAHPFSDLPASSAEALRKEMDRLVPAWIEYVNLTAVAG